MYYIMLIFFQILDGFMEIFCGFIKFWVGFLEILCGCIKFLCGQMLVDVGYLLNRCSCNVNAMVMLAYACDPTNLYHFMLSLAIFNWYSVL